jgi:hypothetical protein
MTAQGTFIGVVSVIALDTTGPGGASVVVNAALELSDENPGL